MSIRDMVTRRSDFNETKDFFPTPPYATRALFEYVIPEAKGMDMEVWDPACGKGHMSRVFDEYGFRSRSSDVEDYGYPGTEVDSFQELARPPKLRMADAVITNPPYGDMADFVHFGLGASKRYLALLTRIQFLEGQERHRKLFKDHRPTYVAVFADRIPFRKDIVVPKAPKMFTHCWCVWDKGKDPYSSELCWIPPDAQEKLQRAEDYE